MPAKNQGSNQKSEPRLTVKDPALEKAVSDLVASGEVTGKANETVLLHRPQGLKAKRLLVVGAGKAKSFSHAEVRKAAGSAVRFLKPKMIKSCAFVLPELPSGARRTPCAPWLKARWSPTSIRTPTAVIAKTSA